MFKHFAICNGGVVECPFYLFFIFCAICFVVDAEGPDLTKAALAATAKFKEKFPETEVSRQAGVAKKLSVVSAIAGGQYAIPMPGS